MPSADVRPIATAAVLLAVAAALGGCVETTQQKNARAQLRAERLLASRTPLRVSTPAPNVSVTAVAVLRSHAGTAVLVALHNSATSAVSDLPVSVAERTAARRVQYLNGASELPYFQTHMGSIAPGARASWVLVSAPRAGAGVVFARVGAAAARVLHLPSISATVTAVRPAGSARSMATVRIANRSPVAQSELELYAYALVRGRLQAAGVAAIESLPAGASTRVQVPLLGSASASDVRIEAPPTNLR